MTQPQTSAPAALGLPTGTYAIDPGHSEIAFTARHAMVTKVRGVFREVEGTIVVADDLAASTATATFQSASVDTGNADRDGHLRTGDFFEAEAHPAITFTSTAVRELQGSTFVLDGDLTIKGVTHPVSLDVESFGTAQDPFGNTRAGFSARTEIEREQWGLTFNAALETGGVLVSRRIGIELEISAVKQA